MVYNKHKYSILHLGQNDPGQQQSILMLKYRKQLYREGASGQAEQESAVWSSGEKESNSCISKEVDLIMGNTGIIWHFREHTRVLVLVLGSPV